MQEQVKPGKAVDADAYRLPTFDEAWNKYRRRIYSLCYRMVGHDTALAEDLTQEAFLQLHRKMHLFRGDSQFSTWFHRLTINVVLMHMRKKSLPTFSIEQMQEDFEADGRSSHERALACEDRELRSLIDRTVIERAIYLLPAGYRLILVLHDIEGMEHHEIAETFGWSIGNSKSQLHKARRAVARIIGAPEFAFEEPEENVRTRGRAETSLDDLFENLKQYAE